MGRFLLCGVLAAALLSPPLLSPGLSAGRAEAADGELRRIGAQIDINDNELAGLIAGGAEVKVKGRSSGRIWLLGADVQLDAEVLDSVYAAGANAKLMGKIQTDLHAFGSRVTIGSAIEGDLMATGSRLDVTKDAKVGGATTLTGSKVSFAGAATGPVSIDANDAEFAGSAKSGLRIEASRVHITDSAVIDGDADFYTSAEPIIDAGAKISGHVQRHSLAEVSALRALEANGPLSAILPALFLLGSALMAGLLLLWLGRGGAEGAIDELIDSPAASGLWGVAGLIVLPVAVTLLTLTIIGAPVGVLALLALPLFLLLGYACAGLGLGEWFFNRLGEPRSAGLRAFHLLAGLVCLGLLGLIPFAGSIVLVVAVLCGLGALLRTMHDRLRGTTRV